jgi:tRNA(Ile)-lysidine synthase
MRRPIKRTERTPRIDCFAESVLIEWRTLKLPASDASVVVAVSGGADSTALLLALHELTQTNKLNLKLIAAHLDHGLRENTRSDAKFVSSLAEQLGIRAVIGRADVSKLADEDNLEQAARKARYAFLERTAKRTKANYILVAHTMDDQAETVLLRLVRGSASEGLSGMEPSRRLSPGSPIQVIRPLLSWARRSDTESYCQRKKVNFLVDSMNFDEKFARVKVRRQLLPLMQSFNNKIVETLSRTASLLREDSESLGNDAAKLLELAARKTDRTDHPALSVSVLAQAPPALRRRALRQWLAEGRGDLRRIERVHLLAVERLLEGTKGGRVAELPNGAKVQRVKEWLELLVKKG